MDEEIRQALSEVREMKQMCGNINMKLTNIVTQRGQDYKKKLEAEYQKGFDDAHRISEEEYQRGLDDAWECAKKLFSTMSDTEIEKVFPTEWENGYYGLMQMKPQYAIAKLKAYEEKQKADDKIEVGDELEHAVSGYTSKAIFLEKIGNDEDEDWYKCLFWTGCGVTILSYPKSQFKRTGNHFDIDKILEAMKHD